MTTEESHDNPGQQPPGGSLLELSDDALTQAIAEQRDAVASSERAFIQMRDRFDRMRRRLRDLETEVERRQRATSASESETQPSQEKKARRKRSTTGMDALIGRDGIEPERPFARLRLLSLQRQEVLLNHTGARDKQILGFVDPKTGALQEASTFGEARVLHETGMVLGWPGVPLQRQAIWYVAEGKPGWLRLDQLFVEQDAEDE